MFPSLRQSAVQLSLWGAILLLPSLQIAVRGHEVDQYDLPEGKRMADLGPYWDRMLREAVLDGVSEVNAAIDRNEKYNHIPALREAALRKLHTPSRLVREVREQLPSAWMAIEQTEFLIHVSGKLDLEPGQVAGYFAPLHNGTFTHMPLWPDVRQLSRIALLRSSLIQVHGTYLGTDKLGHFVGMGYWYYTFYFNAISGGKSRTEAIAEAIERGSRGPISEHGLLGTAVTGVVSNADMAANYLGMKYFINVTEPVMLQGHRIPPMAVLKDGRWALGRHVRRGSGHFALFVSEHLDEVLNPSEYEPGMRNRIREQIRERGPRILDWYAGEDLTKRTPEFFDAALARCLTYYGEDYGHFGNLEDLITISDVCFPSSGGPILDIDEPSHPSLIVSSFEPLPSIDGIAVRLRAMGLSVLHRENPYVITVENNRSTFLENAEVVATVPTPLLPTSVGQQGVFDAARREVRWTIPWLPAGRQTDLSFQAIAVEAGSDWTMVTVRLDGDELLARQQKISIVDQEIPARQFAEPSAPSARRAPKTANLPWYGQASR